MLKVVPDPPHNPHSLEDTLWAGLFAGKPAPTGSPQSSRLAQSLWERVYPRKGPSRQSRIFRGFNNDYRRHPIHRRQDHLLKLMGYVRELTITGLMDEKPMMIWAAHYLSAMAKALMDDAELGMKR